MLLHVATIINVLCYQASNETGNKKSVTTNTSTQTATKQIMVATTSTQIATKQILETNKEPSTQKQTSPTLYRKEGPSNHIAAAALTKSTAKSARPLNSVRKFMYVYASHVLVRV